MSRSTFEDYPDWRFEVRLEKVVDNHPLGSTYGTSEFHLTVIKATRGEEVVMGSGQEPEEVWNWVEAEIIKRSRR